jgi:uncharacterized protein YbaR (Trm112 family)
MKKEIISKQLLEVLACPLCKEDVALTEYQKETYGLKCIKCHRIYPIDDGIPIMIVEEAITES